MNFETVKETLENIKNIEKEAELVLDLIHEISPIKGHFYLNEITFDDVDVEFKGFEYYRGCSEENHSYSFPITLIYDLEERNLFLENKKREVEKREKEKIEKTNQEKLIKEKIEYEAYLKMKEKFENQ